MYTIGEAQSSLQVRFRLRDVQPLVCVNIAQWAHLAVIIADGEYPVRPAFSLLTKILDDFIAKVPQSSFSTPAAISFPELDSYLQKYQDPRQADAIMKVQQELDETKIILVSSTRKRAYCCSVLTTTLVI